MLVDRVADVNEALNVKVFKEKMRLLSGRAPVTILTNIANGAIIAFLCGPCLAHPTSWVWLGIMALLVAFRIAQVRAYRRNPDRRSPKQWANHFVFGAASMGIGWAIGIVMFGTGVEPHHIAMIAFLVSGMTAGSVAIGAAHRPISLAFSLPILASLFIALIIRGTMESYILAFSVAMYGFILLSILKFLSDEVDRSIRQGFEKDALANDLRHALAREESARAAQTQLVANVSHELRTPLSAVIGMIDLAKASEDEVNRKHFLSIARDSSDALLVMLDDLLEVSRLDLGHLDLKSEPMSPSVLAQSVGDLFRGKAENVGLQLVTKCDWPSNAVILGDNNRVRQILVNLVGNAIKFTNSGQITLSVEECVEGGEVKAVEFRVRDTGVGISPEHHARIFERFQQVDGGNTRTHQGTGLGLAISKELAEAMGGSLIVESEVGKGSVFIFTLPCEVATADAASAFLRNAPIAEAEETSDNEELLDLNGFSIDVAMPDDKDQIYALIVDDNEINCVLISAMLGQAGIHYEVVNDGQEALNRLAREDAPCFDVVLMDVQMPEMDGLEATRRLRTLEHPHQQVPVIAVTANAFKEQCQACVEAGMQGFVVKPIDADKLVSEVKRVTGSPYLDKFICAG